MCRHPNAKTENVPIEAARPTQTVETSGRTWRIVSNTAIPAVTDPPGEFTYIVMSWSVREHCEIGLIVEKICHHFFGIRCIQPEQLCNYEVAAVIINCTAKADNALFTLWFMWGSVFKAYMRAMLHTWFISWLATPWKRSMTTGEGPLLCWATKWFLKSSTVSAFTFVTFKASIPLPRCVARHAIGSWYLVTLVDCSDSSFKALAQTTASTGVVLMSGKKVLGFAWRVSVEKTLEQRVGPKQILHTRITWLRNALSLDQTTCLRREEKGGCGWQEAKTTSEQRCISADCNESTFKVFQCDPALADGSRQKVGIAPL